MLNALTPQAISVILLSLHGVTAPFPPPRNPTMHQFPHHSLFPLPSPVRPAWLSSYLEHLAWFMRRTTGAVSPPRGKHNTWKRKRSISLARTFKPSWIIHVHISAPHLLTSREVLLFPTPPSNEIWMAFSRPPAPPPKDGCLSEVITGLWKLQGCWRLCIMSSLHREDILRRGAGVKRSQMDRAELSQCPFIQALRPNWPF